MVTFIKERVIRSLGHNTSLSCIYGVVSNINKELSSGNKRLNEIISRYDKNYSGMMYDNYRFNGMAIANSKDELASIAETLGAGNPDIELNVEHSSIGEYSCVYLSEIVDFDEQTTIIFKFF